jgi:serine/threonine protein kinase, bacterial
VYLTDFGIAVGTAEEPGLTRSGAFMGSVAYAAPERCEGERGGPAADIYALGCVIYEAITGRAPFNRESELATMTAHLHDPIPSLSAQAAQVPAELDEVVRIALAKDPAQRFASAGEMAIAIEAAGTEQVVRRPAIAARDRPARSEVTGLTESVATGARVRRRRRRAAIALGTLATATVAVLVLVLSSGGRRSPLAPRSTGPARVRTASIHVSALPVELSFQPGAVALVGSDTVAVADPAGDRIWLAHRSGRPPTPIDVGRRPSALAVDASGRVWVAESGSNDVRVVDPSGARTLARVPVGRAPSAVAVGGGIAWVADQGSSDVTRVDLATLRRIGAAIPTGGRAPVAIAYGSGANVWIANRGSSDVTVIHAHRGTSTLVHSSATYVAGTPISVAGGTHADAWVGTVGNRVVHLGSSGQQIGSPIVLSASAAALAVVGDDVWVLVHDDATLSLIPAAGAPGIPARVSLSPAELPDALACQAHLCVVNSRQTRQLVSASY